MPQQHVRRKRIAAGDDAAVGPVGEDDADVDAPAARLHQFEQDRVAGEVGILQVNVLAGLAGCRDLGAQDLRVAGARAQQSYRVIGGAGRYRLQAFPVDELLQVAQHPGCGPCLQEMIADIGDDRALDFNHQVVPVIAVFTPDVHAAEEGCPCIDQDGLGVIAGKPDVCHCAHLHGGVLFEVTGDGRFRLMIGWL